MPAANRLELRVFETELRWMALVTSAAGVRLVAFDLPSAAAARRKAQSELSGEALVEVKSPHELQQRLTLFAAGEPMDFSDVTLDGPKLSPFQAKVVRACRAIGFGKTLSYGELAERAGSPRAARAVGTVMKSNRTPLIVPCHRVVASQGKLGGYSAAGGLCTKERLLELEQAAIER